MPFYLQKSDPAKAMDFCILRLIRLLFETGMRTNALALAYVITPYRILCHDPYSPYAAFEHINLRVNTVFPRIVRARSINFTSQMLRGQFEGALYSRARFNPIFYLCLQIQMIVVAHRLKILERLKP